MVYLYTSTLVLCGAGFEAQRSGNLLPSTLVLYVAGFGCATLGQLVAVDFGLRRGVSAVCNARASYLVGALGQLGGGAGDMRRAYWLFLFSCFFVSA